VGRRSWIEAYVGAPAPEDLSALFEGEHREATPVYVAVNGQHAAAMAIHDQPRPGAAAALAKLKETGIRHTVMLTGDAETTAKSVASRLGIDEVYADLSPDDKSRILEELRQSHGPVAMVGDGVNDAPALAAADVGIALGGAGTDVALETADVVLMGDDLGNLARAVQLSRRTRRIVLQNLVFAVSVMVGLVFAALMGWIGLTEGVIGHEGSTILVAFNGLRLLGDGR
jgi:Cd2+/Zn2+-exporting ATPase